jgi:hypothetical protein
MPPHLIKNPDLKPAKKTATSKKTSANRKKPKASTYKKGRLTDASETSTNDKPASEQIDAIIEASDGWHGKRLSELRVLILQADTDIIEEVKWKKPSKPSGVPVWSHNGIVCIGETLKNAVRLTFPKGALVKDPKKLFNTRLDSNSIRAIDFYENDTVDEAGLKALIIEAAKENA